MENVLTMLNAIPKSNYAINTRLNRTSDTKLVAINETKIVHDTLNHLDKFFDTQDVIVVNDASVIPGSFQGIHFPSNSLIEFRLVRFLGSSRTDFSTWEAIVYGEGNWTSPTENRLLPPDICIGDLLITGDLVAKVINISSFSKRLLTIEFQEPEEIILHKIFTYGKMIQYSYLQDELKIWDHQTIFSTYPISIEPNSASFQLNWDLMFKLQKKGVQIIPLTHAISISNTGIEELDKQLPFSERYWLSQRSADMLNDAIDKNKNIIAFGTSVTRSLESIMLKSKEFISGSDKVDLIISKSHRLQVTNGILTGMHMINESHINLLQAFLPLELLLKEYSYAMTQNFKWHEYGDNMLIKNF